MAEKVAAVKEFLPPSSRRQMRRFFGMLNFYRRFIPNCAAIAAPLYSLTGADRNEIKLTPEQIKAFESLKIALSEATVLAHPDPTAPLSIMVDASNDAADAVLHQGEGSKQQPLAFFSRAFSKTEKRYSTFGRELLAAYLAVKHFRHLAEAGAITIFTDHLPLVSAFLSGSAKYAEREIRQLDFIAQFDLKFSHVSGSNNVVADTLSRAQINNLKFSDGIDYKQLAADQQEAGYQLSSLPPTFSSISIDGSTAVICDTKNGLTRPLLPVSWRRKIFDLVHSLSHPGVKATKRLVSARYTWKDLSKDVRD